MKTKILILVSLLITLFTACDDVLDRPQLTQPNDENFWTSENKLRLYVNEFYPRHFVGYNEGTATTYTTYTGYMFSDDVVMNGSQEQFELSVPNDRGSTSSSITWESKYTGPTWNFYWVRKANIMLERVSSEMGSILNEDQMNHWLGIGRFFRGMEYAGLVAVFGDVPYYDKEVGSSDFEQLYKSRTPRNEVMDAVYDDLVFALNNVRLDDGDQYVNRYVVAGYISRLALFEGTWQKYHNSNTERATKFLSLAVQAAEVIRSSGKFDIVTDFRTLFTSNSLAGNKDCIWYRKYDGDLGIKHAVATACNLGEGRYYNPNLALAKAFICNDGSDWQTSSDPANKDFSMENLIKTRDPRFEATFWRNPTPRSLSSYLYITKFINRDGLKYIDEGGAPAPEYTSTNNVSDGPILRYAEVLLNMIEAKAELATLGGTSVAQSDIEATINKLRNRPLDPAAEALGVKKTKLMDLNNLPNSPGRGDVSQLIWEIRRERRMELAFEHSRIMDLRRWKKLEYMDSEQNPDLIRGTWVNFPKDFPDQITGSRVGILAVTDMNGNRIVYDGSNADKLIGFYSATNLQGRSPFLNVYGVNPYLAPVGRNQRIHYKDRGYELAQTEGWPDAI